MSAIKRAIGTRGPTTTIAQTLIVALVAAGASASRLLLRTPNAFSDMVWAEDGLFPLCVRKVGFIACLTDSFAGYLLAVPRGIAGGVALLPMSAWPLTTNLIATVLIGLASGTVFATLRRAHRSMPASVLIALLPAAAPIMGFETLGVIASVYTLLLFATGVFLACQPDTARWSTQLIVVAAIALLLCALTIPSAIALAIGLTVQVMRGRIPRHAGFVLAGALGVGLMLQGLVILAADEQRTTTPTLGALSTLGEALPNALLTLMPGFTAGPALALDFPVTPPAGLGIVVAAAMLILGVMLLISGRSASRDAVGVLLLTGLVILAVPTLTGYPNNRYFAAPILLWAAAALIALDARLKSSLPRLRTIAWAGIAALLLYFWATAWPVSTLRGTVFPSWSSELTRITDECAVDPNRQVVLQFSPGWPPTDLVLPEPTNAVVRCVDLRLTG